MKAFPCRVVFVLGVAVASLSAHAQQWQVVDLGTNVSPASINNSGVVVGGVSTPPTPTTPPQSWPFVWQNGTLTIVQPPGWSGGMLLKINSNGVAVGQAQFADPTHPTAPFSWSNGTITLLPVGAGNIGAAAAINDGGIIGGFLQPTTSGGFGGNIPFLFQNGTTTLLPALGGGGGGVTAINGNGAAVGAVTDTSSATWPTLWVNGQLTILPQLGGNNAAANSINDAGVIAGYSSIPSSPWATNAVLWQNGAIQDLGAIAGNMMTMAWGINQAGQVVGGAFGSMTPAAFIYQNGAMQTLDVLTGGTTGWHFWMAQAINDKGQIVGSGIPPNPSNPYDVHGFILSPAMSPEDVIAAAIAAIESFALNAGLANSLETKLQAVAQSLDKAKPGACGQLAAFTHEVEAQSGKGLSSAQAERLLAEAQKLAAMIGCN